MVVASLPRATSVSGGFLRLSLQLTLFFLLMVSCCLYSSSLSSSNRCASRTTSQTTTSQPQSASLSTGHDG